MFSTLTDKLRCLVPLLAAFPLFPCATSAQSLCSQLYVTDTGSPYYWCNVPSVPLQESRTWTIRRLVAYSESCPLYVSHQETRQLSATGQCGGGGGVLGPDCPPQFDYRVQLIGNGPTFDECTHKFDAYGKSFMYVAFFYTCFNTATSYVTWETPAANCRVLQPGESCPEVPSDPFGE